MKSLRLLKFMPGVLIAIGTHSDSVLTTYFSVTMIFLIIFRHSNCQAEG